MVASPYQILPGHPHPLGATPDRDGVNFSLFSESASAIDLLLFERHDDPQPAQVIRLDAQAHKTFSFWHVYVRGLGPGAHYAYRVDGPGEISAAGHRFNRNKVVVDPYARGNTTTLWRRADACGPMDNVATAMRSVVIDLDEYDWEGDQPLRRRMCETIIYELHVGGFTRSPSAGVSAPGTFQGVIEKIPFLQALGITAVELLPVFAFDDSEVLRRHPETGAALRNYWGYSTIGFFAPHSGYCVSDEIGAHVREFRDMVKALHRAGIEVILDVVFNHTDEGNHLGPTLSFKGTDNSVYYHLEPYDKQYYTDYSGCGNTLNCNHPIVNKLIVDCLEFWVKEMHVDGFRFDEGSVLARGEGGSPMRFPPVIWQIELAESLADTKVIAEAWDAAGLYQVGYFPGYRWAEWNGRYRDSIRRFVKGDPGLAAEVACRISGSADLYQSSGRLPINSINFVTCHDGFTLNDLVAYDQKHNEANGEGNRDGMDQNDSWNCGVEGPCDDPAVERLRRQQIKNFATILLVSQGTPMILGGDELRRTQHGNNNAYCQDTVLSWFDWTRIEQHAETFRFFREMIAFRRRHIVLHQSRFFTGAVNERGIPDIAWHGCRLYAPGWHDADARVLAFTLGGFSGGADVHVMLNMYWLGLDFELPPLRGDSAWHRVVDTARPAPDDFCPPGYEPPLPAPVCHVQGRSIVVLISKERAYVG